MKTPMQLVAKWQDSRNKEIYRPCSDAREFVLEKEAKDALGESTWREMERFDKTGSSAGLHSILGIGLEEVAKHGKSGLQKDAIVDPDPIPIDKLLNLSGPPILDGRRGLTGNLL